MQPNYKTCPFCGRIYYKKSRESYRTFNEKKSCGRLACVSLAKSNGAKLSSMGYIVCMDCHSTIEKKGADQKRCYLCEKKEAQRRNKGYCKKNKPWLDPARRRYHKRWQRKKYKRRGPFPIKGFDEKVVTPYRVFRCKHYEECLDIACRGQERVRKKYRQKYRDIRTPKPWRSWECEGCIHDDGSGSSFDCTSETFMLLREHIREILHDKGAKEEYETYLS